MHIPSIRGCNGVRKCSGPHPSHGPADGIERGSWKCDPRFRWRDATTGAFLSLQRNQEIEADPLSFEGYGQALRRDVFCVLTRGAGAFPYFWRDGVTYLVLGVEEQWIKWYSIPGGTYDHSDSDVRGAAARGAWGGSAGCSKATKTFWTFWMETKAFCELLEFRDRREGLRAVSKEQRIQLRALFRQ